MEGALWSLDRGGAAVVGSAVDVGFSNLTLQGWKKGSACTRDMRAFVAQGRRGVVEQGQKRSRIARAEASGYDKMGHLGSGGVGFKDAYRRRDSSDGCKSDEREEGRMRQFHCSRNGELGRKGRSEIFRESSDSSKNAVELAGHVDTITSVGNPFVKHLVKLREKASYRNSAGCVVVVGSVPLREICELLTRGSPTSLKPIKILLILEDTNPRSDLSSWAERIVHVSEPVLRKVAGVDSTQGLQGVGVLALPASFCNLEGTGDTAMNWLSSPRRVLVLDGIQDPGNLGTLLRTAAAFAWDGVFMLPGGCDPFNEKALRASRGASFRLPIATGRWSELQSFASMHKMKLYAADPDQKGTWPSFDHKSEHENYISNDGDAITVASASSTFRHSCKRWSWDHSKLCTLLSLSSLLLKMLKFCKAATPLVLKRFSTTPESLQKSKVIENKNGHW
ncbi:uncharacterized protein [Physcomitrium patens]|uniref:uncharacterized protein isoform X5 n=1 Tax=Physcomitrium patens TaxID=3218 RepID=UPI003CCDC7BB